MQVQARAADLIGARNRPTRGAQQLIRPIVIDEKVAPNRARAAMLCLVQSQIYARNPSAVMRANLSVTDKVRNTISAQTASVKLPSGELFNAKLSNGVASPTMLFLPSP